MKVNNAIIMAAGTSSRFAPLSYEKHKALTIVRGEVLIERQIEQLISAGIPDIYIVTGYKAAQFNYLTDKYGVMLIQNPDYQTRNNNGSIWVARNIIRNSYICSSDNYFINNPFDNDVAESYYAAEYADGDTQEWCMTEDAEGYINSVTIGGKDAWYMMGHTFWSEEFSKTFLEILEKEYYLPDTIDKLWENIFIEHLEILKMKMRKYKPCEIFEFDTLDELREFDNSYVSDTRSKIMKSIAKKLNVKESEIINIRAFKNGTTEADGFKFDCKGKGYSFKYETGKLSQQDFFKV